MTTFPKTIEKEIEDLKDHLFLLEDGMKKTGTENHNAGIKQISNELRTLLINTSGHRALSFRLAKKFNYEIKDKTRVSYRPEKFEYRKYVNRLTKEPVVINGTEYTIQKFIRMMAINGGSHEPEEADEIIPYGEAILIGNIPASHRLILAEAKRTLYLGKEFLENIS